MAAHEARRFYKPLSQNLLKGTTPRWLPLSVGHDNHFPWPCRSTSHAEKNVAVCGFKVVQPVWTRCGVVFIIFCRTKCSDPQHMYVEFCNQQFQQATTIDFSADCAPETSSLSRDGVPYGVAWRKGKGSHACLGRPRHLRYPPPLG